MYLDDYILKCGLPSLGDAAVVTVFPANSGVSEDSLRDPSAAWLLNMTEEQKEVFVMAVSNIAIQPGPPPCVHAAYDSGFPRDAINMLAKLTNAVIEANAYARAYLAEENKMAAYMSVAAGCRFDSFDAATTALHELPEDQVTQTSQVLRGPVEELKEELFLRLPKSASASSACTAVSRRISQRRLWPLSRRRWTP